MFHHLEATVGSILAEVLCLTTNEPTPISDSLPLHNLHDVTIESLLVWSADLSGQRDESNLFSHFQTIRLRQGNVVKTARLINPHVTWTLDVQLHPVPCLQHILSLP